MSFNSVSSVSPLEMSKYVHSAEQIDTLTNLNGVPIEIIEDRAYPGFRWRNSDFGNIVGSNKGFLNENEKLADVLKMRLAQVLSIGMTHFLFADQFRKIREISVLGYMFDEKKDLAETKATIAKMRTPGYQRRVGDNPDYLEGMIKCIAESIQIAVRASEVLKSFHEKDALETPFAAHRPESATVHKNTVVFSDFETTLSYARKHGINDFPLKDDENILESEALKAFNATAIPSARHRFHNPGSGTVHKYTVVYSNFGRTLSYMRLHPIDDVNLTDKNIKILKAAFYSNIHEQFKNNLENGEQLLCVENITRPPEFEDRVLNDFSAQSDIFRCVGRVGGLDNIPNWYYVMRITNLLTSENFEITDGDISYIEKYGFWQKGRSYTEDPTSYDQDPIRSWQVLTGKTSALALIPLPIRSFTNLIGDYL